MRYRERERGREVAYVNGNGNRDGDGDGDGEGGHQFDWIGLIDLTIIVMYGINGSQTMKTAALSELKARLSEYVAIVKAGEDLLVTDRGTPVARLVPVTHAATRDNRMEELERLGMARTGSGILGSDFWSLPRPEDTDALVRGAVEEEREEE